MVDEIYKTDDVVEIIYMRFNPYLWIGTLHKLIETIGNQWKCESISKMYPDAPKQIYYFYEDNFKLYKE